MFPTTRLTRYLEQREYELFMRFSAAVKSHPASATDSWHQVREIHLIRQVFLGCAMPSLGEFQNASDQLTSLLPSALQRCLPETANVIHPPMGLRDDQLAAYLQYREFDLMVAYLRELSTSTRLSPGSHFWLQATQLHDIQIATLGPHSRTIPTASEWVQIATGLTTHSDWTNLQRESIARSRRQPGEHDAHIPANPVNPVTGQYRAAISLITAA